MNFPIHSLSGWLFILFVLIENFSLMESYDCKVTAVDNTLRADCKGTDDTINQGLPAGLDPNIQYLDMSHNTVEGLNNVTFDIYPNLIWLSMAYSKLPFVIQHHLLSPLVKLDYFNVSHVSWFDKPDWAWPPNVKIIDASFFQMNYLDVSICGQLEILNISNNDLPDIPVMNKLAPLQLVNISYNPLGSLTAEKLAPYCNLQSLSISLFNNSPLFLPEKYCDCVRINAWVETYHITVSEKLPCSHPSEVKCDTTFSAAILQERQDCLELKTSPSYLKLILIAAGVFLILLLIFLCLAYKYISLEKKVVTGDVEYIEDLSQLRTKIPITPVEELEEEQEEEN